MSSAVKIFQGRFGRVALLDMDGPLIGHAHHHCHILLKVSGADAAFNVRGVQAPLTDDMAVVVNAWEHHTYEHRAPPGDRTLVLALYIEHGWLAELHNQLAMSAHPHFFPQSSVQISTHTHRMMEAFVLEMGWGDEAPAARVEELLFNLIIAVLENQSGWRDAVGLLYAKPDASVDGRIRRAVALMREDISHGINVEALAARCGLSRAQFFALFLRDTRVTPHVYSNVLRFEAAVRLLVQEGVPLSAAACELGFSAPGHFSRFFRQHLGITPSAYRRTVSIFGR